MWWNVRFSQKCLRWACLRQRGRTLVVLLTTDQRSSKFFAALQWLSRPWIQLLRMTAGPTGVSRCGTVWPWRSFLRLSDWLQRHHPQSGSGSKERPVNIKLDTSSSKARLRNWYEFTIQSECSETEKWSTLTGCMTPIQYQSCSTQPTTEQSWIA